MKSHSSFDEDSNDVDEEEGEDEVENGSDSDIQVDGFKQMLLTSQQSFIQESNQTELQIGEMLNAPQNNGLEGEAKNAHRSDAEPAERHEGSSGVEQVEAESLMPEPKKKKLDNKNRPFRQKLTKILSINR